VYVVEQKREIIIVTDLPGVEKENVEISLVYPRTDRDHARENGMKTLEREDGRYPVVRILGTFSRGPTPTWDDRMAGPQQR